MRLLLLVLFAALWLGNTTASASHIKGGDLAFESIPGSPNRYHITARLYRDTQPPAVINFGPDIKLTCGKESCSETAPGSFTTFLLLTRRLSVPPSCQGNIPFEIGVFEGDVTLPQARWTLSISSENRSGGAYNLLEPEMRDFYLGAFLDNSSGLVDSSPKFTSLTFPYVSANELYRHSFSCFDPDGDSLVYRSVQPLASLQGSAECSTPIAYRQSAGGELIDPATGTKVPYGPVQFTPAFPFLSYQVSNGSAVPFFQLNAATGELVTRPVTIGLQIVAIRVEEYRKLGGAWQQIGSIARDIIYYSLNGEGNRNPTVAEVKVAGATTSQSAEKVIPVRPGQSISLTLTATDPDAGQTVRMKSDVGTIIPGASFQMLTNNQAQLSWQVPAQLPLGRYSFTVTAADNGCPINGSEVRTITFLVTNQVLANRSRQSLAQPAYPTPFHEQVQFQLAARKAQAIIIVDELGRVVEQLTSNADGTVVWQPAATVRAGLYIARTADGQQVQRLMRQ